MSARAAVLALAISAASTTPASAQVVLPPGSGGGLVAPALRFDRVTGMAKGAVTAIAQDRSGFLWFGTEEGLTRYDGYDFVSYVSGATETNTLSNFTVTALATTPDALWIGTVKGLDKLELATHTFSHVAAVTNSEVTALDRGASGTLWIGTADAGVAALDPATGKVRTFKATKGSTASIGDDAISSVLETKDKKVWIGTQQAGLDLLDPATGKVTRFTHNADNPQSLSNDQVTSVYLDSRGTLWVGTVDGLNAVDPATGIATHYLKDAENPNWITAIVEGSDEGLWVGVKGVGVFRLDRTSGSVERHTHDGSDPTTISHPWTRCAFSDKGGVLWFGFQAGGASKLNLLRRQFGYYRTNSGLAFLEQGDQVWLGTQGLGLRLLDLGSGTVKSYLDEELRATWTMKIVAGDNDSLWLATTDQGLLHFTRKTGEIVRYDVESGRLTSDAVFALLRDGNSMWVGLFGAGLARLNIKTNTLTYFKSDPKQPQTISSDFVDAIYQDPTDPNLLWIGTQRGLNSFDKRTEKFTRYLHDPANPTSLSHDHVNDIHIDKQGRLWVATWGGGLDRMDRKNGTFTAIHTTNGLSSEVVYGILEDKKGSLWITSNDGLTVLDPTTMHTNILHAADGLQDDEFAQGGFHQGASGRFYVGGPRGFNVFVPERITFDTYMPPVALTSFDVLGEARPIPAKVSLSYRDRVFSLAFSALSFASPNRNRYRVRLVGFHDWIESDRRFVSYSSLPPGDYTLEIVSANAQGIWGKTGVSLPIHVPPPPWRTWWAFSLYLLLALLVAGLFYRRHHTQLDALRNTHRLSELEREVALSVAVQEGFFPPERSVHDGVFRLEAFYRAAAQCGGDWWSYEQRDETYFVVVGDATGHGIGSAMVTAAAASTFRCLGPQIDDETRLQAMNDEVLRVSRGQYHMTLTTVELNLVTGHYLIRSAGGVPVFALAPNARARVLMCPGTPLGSEVFETGALEGQLVPGERLLILTDGIPEVAMANAQILGPRGVSNFYMQTREQELESALANLIQKVEEVSTAAQDDDWTVVMVEWGKPQVLDRSDPTTMVGARTQART